MRHESIVKYITIAILLAAVVVGLAALPSGKAQAFSGNGSGTGDGATGGLIGSHNSNQETPGGTDNPVVRYSYANISVFYSGNGTGDKFGGLAGCSQKGTISNCYARGNVTHSGPGERIGGLAGCIDYRGELFDSYSTGLVTVAANCTKYGGLVGNREGKGGNNGVVTNCFWDTETSNQSSSAGGTGKITLEMQNASTFISAGWNFNDVWAIDETKVTNNGYPYLIWTEAFTPTELTINGSFTADDKVYDGTNAATGNTSSLALNGSLDHGTNVSLTGVEIVFDNASVGINKTVYINIATLTGDDAGNYSLSLVGAPTATANISYTLTTSSTAGGSATTPGEAGPYYYYTDNQVVDISASAEACYNFVNWTGDTGTIANTSAASTNITMSANYTITANFDAGPFCGGNGSADNPYLICDVCDLQAMNLNLSAHYALDNDINASATSAWNGGAGFMPVGSNSVPFTGSFNGQGYNISDLYINLPGTDYVGLFGYIGMGSSVNNVSLVSADVTGYEDVGGLAGTNCGSVSNSSVTGNISGWCATGGLIGDNSNDGTVYRCSAAGNMDVFQVAGGLVGENSGLISCSFATANVIVNWANAGGLVGYNMGTISNSYAMGNASTTQMDDAGGLVGSSNGGGTVNNSYSTGYVSGNGFDVGGLIGYNEDGPTYNSFWDKQTSNTSYSNGGTGKTTAEMKTLSTFNGSGWDIEENTTTNINNGYPYLSWQIPGNSPIWYIYTGPFTFTLNYSAGAGGSLTGNTSQIVAYGGNGTAVEAVPDACYHFVSWNDSSPDNPRTDINVTKNISVTANFAPDSAFASGDGSAGNPYLIQNVCALQNMSSNLSAHYALNNSIDAYNTSTWNGGAGFMPVGNDSTPFTGTFDGRGYSISNLFINRSTTAYVGLFGYTNGSALSDVSLVNMSITGGSYVGGLVGYSISGNVSGSSATGNVRGFIYVGGLAGSLYQGTVNGSYATGDISSSIGGPQLFYAGGLVGVSNGSTVDNSYATGNFSGSDYLGGLVGHNYQGTVNNSYAAGTVTGDEYVGGLVGNNSTTSNVNNSYATGNVSGGSHVGGLVGYNENFSTVNNSHAIGNVIGGTYVGGLIGYNYIASSAYNSYATGNVSGTSHCIGGLIGWNSVACAVNQSYATGEVTGGGSLSDHIGGLVGSNFHSSVDNSYSTGNVSGECLYTGGLAGSNSPGTINNSYAIGNVSGGTNVGGLAGWTSGGSVNRSYSKGTVSGGGNLGGLIGANGGCSVSVSFWDKQTSGQSSSAGGTGVNTSEMKDFFTFFNASWDLICEIPNGTDDIWGLDYSGAGNNGYPFLWWQGLTHNVSFMLNLSSTEGGNVSTPGEGPFGPYNCSEVITIEATPDDGYFFVEWTGNTSTVEDVNDESTKVTMYGNYSIQANFTSVMYNLSTASTAGGNVTAPGEGNFSYGSGHIVTINASPDTCYYFVNWTGDMGSNISDVNSPNTSITMNGNYSITANFAKYQYTLNISATAGGNVSPPGELGPYTYNCSETVDITAVNDSCHYFINWSGTGVDAGMVATPNAASTTINMSDNASVQANFAIYQYTLNTSSTIGGNVSPLGEGTYNCSEIVAINATPAHCWRFVNWTGDTFALTGVETNASNAANMSTNVSLTANFAINTYNLNLSVNGSGSIDTINGSFNCEEIITFNATPNHCWRFVNWSGDTFALTGVETNASNAANMSTNVSLTANFAINTYTLNLSVNGSGSIDTVNGSFNCEEIVAINATPNGSCWRFVNWTGDTSALVGGPVTDASNAANMSANVSLTANFAINQYTLNYSASAGGTINGTSPQTVNCGANGSEVTAVPNASYRFSGWSDGVTTEARTDINVSSNITVQANFRRMGGGGGYAPPSPTININIFDDTSTHPIDGNGVLQQDADAVSPDGKIGIHIPAGTSALDADGSPLTELNVDTIDSYPTPPDDRIVIAAFDFHPDGATFDPAIQITLTYDPATLPEGTDESQLVIAFYNEATEAWEYVTGTVNPDTNTMTFSIAHFTVFAVMAASESSAAPTEIPTPTPTVTVEPTPTTTVSPTPTIEPTPTPATTAPTAGGDNGPDKWVLIVLVVAGGALLAALIGAIVRRKRRSTTN